MWTVGLNIQLEEDGGDSAGHSWMETSDLRPILNWERQGKSQAKSILA